jgi:hypothetical protein
MHADTRRYLDRLWFIGVHRRLKRFCLMDGMIKIKLYRSPICTPQKHKRVVLGLGLLEQLRDKNEIAEMRGLAVEKL